MINYPTFSTLIYSPAIRRAGILLTAVVSGLALGAASSISAQQPAKITVEVGRTKSNSVKHPVDRKNLQIAVAAPAIAKAAYDPNTNRFNFEGLSAGRTRVTIIGTYLKAAPAGNANAGGGMTGGVQPGQQQQAVRYRHIVVVTVVPRVPDPNADAFEAEVVRGKEKDIRIDAVLGPEFLRPSDEGKRWRSLRFTFGDNSIARAELAGKSKVRITGVSPGRTMLRLEGERFKNNVWQTITRPIKVTVSDDPTAQVQADPWIDGMQRRLQVLKSAAEQAGTDERKLSGSVRDLEGFVTPVTSSIANERVRQNREWRLARLENLRDEANNALVKLRSQHAEIAKQVRSIGWHQMLADLDIVLGKRSARRTFTCPPNPNKSHGIAYGTDWYTDNSAICAAAVHAGFIGFGGGNIIVEFRAGIRGDKFMGSKRRGVESYDDNNWSYGSFGFVNSR